MDGNRIEKGSPMWSRLFAMWKSEWTPLDKPGSLQFGNVTYQVLTPNGEDDPVFIGATEMEMYATQSVTPSQAVKASPFKGPAAKQPIKKKG